MASLVVMGNSLLDFVMTLVRDPEAAARYAADPAGVLAEAQLHGVTTVDVNNLVPVVSDSLAMTTPGFGGGDDAVNVWTTGAATAAFDAFGGATPAIHTGPAIIDPAGDPSGPELRHPIPGLPDEAGVDPSGYPVVIEDMPVHPAADPVDWIDPAALPDHHLPDGPHHDVF